MTDAQVGCDREDRLGQVVEEFFDAVAHGETPDISDYLRRYPEIADLLKIVIPAMLATEHAAARSEPASLNDIIPQEKQLGDFRILRQIGRGGMGIVYEAEQISMKRRVALKVLPLAGLVDELKIRRFQNEVRAVAALNHPNIVPVYTVGQERGVHYYAMQLIHGSSLSDVIASLQLVRDDGARIDGTSISQVTSVWRGPEEAVAVFDSAAESVASDSSGKAQSQPREAIASASSSTIPHSSQREYYRSVAALGIQAATALQYAHEQGVVHRDIKPANLLLDASATLFVTDFGLARIESDVGVTMTGDLVGTLRYMAPEQALAKRVVVDHRADIYSLGVTLYELLTLQPAYRAEDRQQLLKQIAFEEPTSLRRIDPQISAELQTIVHKAMSKDMDQRYISAEELADDLRSHLENRPIKAKPPSTSEIISKWTRRNPILTWATIITLSLVTLTLATSTVLISRQLVRATTAEREAKEAHDEADARATELARRNYMLHVANANKALQEFEYERTQAELDACPPELRGWEWSYLEQRVQATFPMSFPGSEKPIFTRDGKRLIAIGSHDTPEHCMVVTWDLASREVVGRLAHESRLSHIAMSTDEQRIAGADHKGNLIVWDVESGEKLWTVKRHEHPSQCQGLAFSPDGRLIASGSNDRTLVVVDATNGDLRFRLGPFGRWTQNITFSPDGRWIASAARNRKTPAMIIHAASGEIAATFPSEGGNVPPTFAPRGQRIITANVDGSIKVWNWDGEQLIKVDSWPDAGRDILSFDFSNDGTRLVSTNNRPCAARVWDVTTGEKLTTIDTGDLVYWSAFSPSGDEVALFSVSGGIRIWQWRGHEEEMTFKALDGPVKARFNPAGKLILASTPMFFHGGLRSPNHFFPPESAAVVSAESGEEVLTIDESVYEASWSPDGQEIIATLKSDKALRTYDAATGERLRTFPDRKQRFTIAQVAPSGRRLVAFSRDGTLRVMDFKSGEEYGEHPLRDISAVGASLSRDASLVAFAVGIRVEIWDTRNKTKTSSLEAPGHWLKRFVFSDGGNRLYVGGKGGLLMEVDVATGQETNRFVGHVGTVLGIALSPDECQIVSGDNSSGRVIIWDVASGQQLLTLTDGDQPIISLDWSSDGHRIVAGKGDGTVRIWTLPRSQ